MVDRPATSFFREEDRSGWKVLRLPAGEPRTVPDQGHQEGFACDAQPGLHLRGANRRQGGRADRFGLSDPHLSPFVGGGVAKPSGARGDSDRWSQGARRFRAEGGPAAGLGTSAVGRARGAARFCRAARRPRPAGGCKTVRASHCPGGRVS